MIAVVWACAVAGDLTSFYLGRRLGRAFLVKHGPKVQITEDAPGAGRALLRPPRRQGDPHRALRRPRARDRALPGRLVGDAAAALRALRRHRRRRCGARRFVLLGYVFWQSFSQLVDYAKKGALALGAVIVLVVAIVWLVRWLRDPDNRARMRAWLERQAERPALRPLARVAGGRCCARRGGPARFVWDRVTPGDLGLELTTLLAVASVGAFVFVWDLVRIEQDTACSRATPRRCGWPTGSTWTCWSTWPRS